MSDEPVPRGQEPEDQTVDPAQAAGTGGWLRRLLRLALVVGLGVGVGLALYLALPALVRAWLEPVEQNQALVEALSDDLDSFRREQERANESLGERLSAVEAELLDVAEQMAAGGDQLHAAGDRLEVLEADLADLRTAVGQIGQLEDDLEGLGQAVATLEAEPKTDPGLETLGFRLDLIGVMEVVARARLELLQANYGLAQDNIQTAYDRLASLTPPTGIVENDTLAALERLALAEKALPQAPQVAAEDLESVWLLLLDMTEPAATAPETEEATLDG
ncbi:MAG TPA: hypothetical protein VGA52_09685 [Anaerolineales bacterium]